MSRLKMIPLVLLLAAALAIPAVAQTVPTPIPISSEDAFDAVQTQTDPITGESKKILLIDTRTRAEFFWIGVPAALTELVLDNGRTFTPDLGKAFLRLEGRLVDFRENGRRRIIPTKKIASVTLEPITRIIPYRLWDEDTGTLVQNDEAFREAVEALATEEGVDVLIFFCRSGGRSQSCLAAFDTTLFDELYEIDQPSGVTGRGGFEGTTYSNVYLGYRGFPQRVTPSGDDASVAWKDAGLPIRIGVRPF